MEERREKIGWYIDEEGVMRPEVHTVSIRVKPGYRLSAMDLVLKEDIIIPAGTTLMDNSVVPETMVFKKGKKYFTLDEIRILTNSEYRPLRGRLLPSADDWRRLIPIYGHNGPNSMMKIVGLKLNGLIEPKDMAEYNADPEGFKNIQYLGEQGYYLADPTYSDGTSALCLIDNGYLDVNTAYPDGGYSVRLLYCSP